MTPSLPGPEGEAFFVSGPGMHTGVPAWVRGHRMPFGAGRWILGPDGWLSITPTGLSSDLRCSQFHGVGPLEHYAAGLALSGSADWALEVSGADLPLVDGSSISMMRSTGCGVPWIGVPKDFLHESVNERGGWLRACARPEFSVSSSWALPSGEIETWEARGDEIRRCGRARTFIDIDSLAMARGAGLLQGCSLAQGMVLGPARSAMGHALADTLGLDFTANLLSGNPLRLDGEVAAHKALDLIGDLALWTGGVPCLEVAMQGVGHREFHALGCNLNEWLSCGSG